VGLALALVRSMVHFMADQAAYSRATDSSDGAATGQNGTANGTSASPDSRVLVLPGHSGAAGKRNQQGRGQATDDQTPNGICCLQGEHNYFLL
jgi:hypothetical protein